MKKLAMMALAAGAFTAASVSFADETTAPAKAPAAAAATETQAQAQPAAAASTSKVAQNHGKKRLKKKAAHTSTETQKAS